MYKVQRCGAYQGTAVEESREEAGGDAKWVLVDLLDLFALVEDNDHVIWVDFCRNPVNL